ncbi:hypothetical protein [Actinocrispum sp. NPDC049592]|uniref:hypothetical protein n=1 Tax=Actinocrispum sp. NPDC049592 TaxID=3154835 RepID=UPI003443DB84
MKPLLTTLLLTPSLVLIVSLAGRRWGPAIGGKLAALPLTSGPLVLVTAFSGNVGVARSMAHGVLAGMPAVVVFCAGYRYVAKRCSWQASLTIAGSATAFVAALLSLMPPPLWLTAAVICTAATTAMAHPTPLTDGPPATPTWELLLRMAFATTLVLALSTLSHLADPRLAGVLATFPALMFVLAPMAHRRDGATAAIQMMHGLIAGLLPTLLFYVVVAAF